MLLAVVIGPDGAMARQQASDVPLPGSKTLANVALATPFTVRELKGTIKSSRHQPLAEAELELEYAKNCLALRRSREVSAFRLCSRSAARPGECGTRTRSWTKNVGSPCDSFSVAPGSDRQIFRTRRS